MSNLLYPQSMVTVVRKSGTNQIVGQGLINLFPLLNCSETEILSAIRGCIWRLGQAYAEDDFSQECDTEAETWRRGLCW